MTGKNKFYFWTIWATAVLLFIFFIYKTSEKEAFVQQIVTMAGISVWLLLAHLIVKFYPLTNKNWKRVAPDQGALFSAAFPLYFISVLLLQNWAFLYVFEDRFDFLNFDPAIAFLHSPILIVITGLASVYGIMTSFGRRLRWNSEGIDYRDMFFESRFVRWDEIDRIDLCAAVFTDEIILKNRPRLVFAKVAGRAGLDLLEADARVNGVEFVATKGGSNLWRRWLGQADQGSEIKKKGTEPRHQNDWQ